MISEYKAVMDDLLNYTVHGQHLGLNADGFNGVSFDSTAVSNIKYQFIRKQETANQITDPSIVPILVISQPEQYLKGRVYYNNKFEDLRTLLVKGVDGMGQPIKKINFFVIPQFISTKGHNLGSIGYDVKIDYVTEFDTYGFMSKEIDSILKRHYFRKHMGEYHFISSNNGSNLYFVPTNSRFLNQPSYLNRIAQSFEIKFCSLV